MVVDPVIRNWAGKKMIGLCRSMSFAENETPELWRAFMPRRNEIQNAIGTELYSIQSYPLSFFNPFNPNTTFEKWAAKEVNDFSNKATIYSEAYKTVYQGLQMDRINNDPVSKKLFDTLTYARKSE